MPDIWPKACPEKKPIVHGIRLLLVRNGTSRQTFNGRDNGILYCLLANMAMKQYLYNNDVKSVDCVNSPDYAVWSLHYTVQTNEAKG
jgi:hypothetical protein